MPDGQYGQARVMMAVMAGSGHDGQDGQRVYDRLYKESYTPTLDRDRIQLSYRAPQMTCTVRPLSKFDH